MNTKKKYKKHYSLSDLEKYTKKDINFVHRFFIKRHLNKCKECKDRLQCIGENEDLLNSIRNAINEDIPQTDKQVYKKLETLLSSDVADKRR